jgi:predicted nuclease with RNAse H fold/5-methylcytosine-specific restriction endonuclease McrA
MTLPPLTIGIDVGAPTKGFHAVALRGIDLVEKFHSTDAGQVAQWCVTRRPAVVSIDAPCRWRAESGNARLAERELAAEGISSFSTPTESKARGHAFYTWMLAGHDLFAALAPTYPIYTDQRHSERVAIETFPHAVACALAGTVVSAKAKFKVRGDLLRHHGINASAFTSVDEIDAALCAVAASAFVGGNFRSYGDIVGGFIVVPATVIAAGENAVAVVEAIGAPVELPDPVMRWPIPKWIPRVQSTDCGKGEARTTRAMLRDGGCCIYCGLDLVTNTELLLSAELDHLVPQVIFREAGVTGYIKTGDYLANLVFCCGPCNDAKDNWPVCAEEPERTRLLTSASRQDYIAAATTFTLARRRTAEKRVAKLMAKVWAQRASKLEAGKAGTSSASLTAVESGIVQTVLARAAR